jgi:hypothetical protein
VGDHPGHVVVDVYRAVEEVECRHLLFHATTTRAYSPGEENITPAWRG